MSRKITSDYTYIAVALAFAILVSGAVVGISQRVDVLRLSPISFYQGIHPSFEGIGYHGNLYTSSNTYDASISNIGPATINWDPDKATAEMPNIRGELRDIQIVDDLAKYEVQGTLAHIISDFGGEYIPNRAYRTYNWRIDKDGDGRDDREYRMELWLCSMEVYIWVDPSRGGFWTWSREIGNKRYDNLDVWLKLEASQDWGHYFTDLENLSNTYFGLGYLELADIDVLSEDHTRLTVVPGSQWSAFDLYNNLGGAGQVPDDPDSQAYIYEGTELNPGVFKSEWYTKINFGDIGTYDYNAFTRAFKSDGVKVKALAHIFVVGEWIVQPPEEDDRDIEPQEPPWKENPFYGLTKRLGEIMSSPLGRLKVGIWVAVVIFFLVVFFNPGAILYVVDNWGKAVDEVKRRSNKGKT